MWTYTPKCGHILIYMDKNQEMWTYTHMGRQKPRNVDIYSYMWTKTRKCGLILIYVDKTRKCDKIPENDSFGLSKSGIEYSVGA